MARYQPNHIPAKMDLLRWCVPITLLAMLMTLLTWILIYPPAVPCLAASLCFPHNLTSLPSAQPSALPSGLNVGAEHSLHAEPHNPPFLPSAQPSALPSGLNGGAEHSPDAEPRNPPSLPSAQPSALPSGLNGGAEHSPDAEPHNPPSLPSAQPSALPSGLNGGAEHSLHAEPHNPPSRPSAQPSALPSGLNGGAEHSLHTEPHNPPSRPSAQPSALSSGLNGGAEHSLDVELLPFPADGAESNEVCPWRRCVVSKRDCGACREERPEADKVPAVPDGWMPDVKKLRRFALAGADAQGRQFPPKLPEEVCRPIPFGRNPADAVVKLRREAQLKVQTAGSAGPSIMCIIYTTEKHHYSQLRAMRETWAGGCDGWLAFSTLSDPRIPAISIPHAGKEEYKNMWQKVRSIWRFVAKHYSEEFGFFVMGGDDMFIMPQNLRNYLTLVGADPSKQHFLGRRMRTGGNKPVLFNSGGSGYVLSRRTLHTLDKYLDDSRCRPQAHTSAEDVNVAECLWKVAGVQPADTRDELGRERFHPFGPGATYYLKPGDGWYERYHRDWGLKYGKDCCAPDSVSFHYVKPPSQMRHLYALLYTCGD